MLISLLHDRGPWISYRKLSREIVACSKNALLLAALLILVNMLAFPNRLHLSFDSPEYLTIRIGVPVVWSRSSRNTHGGVKN